jgi:hypothetical protein
MLKNDGTELHRKRSETFRDSRAAAFGVVLDSKGLLVSITIRMCIKHSTLLYLPYPALPFPFFPLSRFFAERRAGGAARGRLCDGASVRPAHVSGEIGCN